MITTTLLGLIGLVTRPFKHPQTLGVTKAKGIFELRHGELKEAALKLLDNDPAVHPFNMWGFDTCFFAHMRRLVPRCEMTAGASIACCSCFSPSYGKHGGYEAIQHYFGLPDSCWDHFRIFGMSGPVWGYGSREQQNTHAALVLNFVKEQCTRNGWDYETL